MELDRYSRTLLQGAHRNPAPPSRTWPDVRELPWRAERSVRLAWLRAYLDALGYTGEMSEARWERAMQAPHRAAFLTLWGEAAAPDESKDALVEARRTLVDDPQELGATLTVDWRQVTEDALRHWWNMEEDARALLDYAAPRISRQARVRLAAACARTALRYIPEGEARPRIAIETAEAWARGEATLDQVRKAASAAEAAGYTLDADAAATAAFNAAWTAIDTPAASDAAIDAVNDAAAAAATATDDPLDATWPQEMQRSLRALADLIRSKQPFPGGL